MRAVERELAKRGILYESSDEDVMRGAEYDTSKQLVDITDKFIITIMYSMVLDPTLYIYDRKTLNLIGEQQLYPDYTFANPTSNKTSKTWGSWGATA